MEKSKLLLFVEYLPTKNKNSFFETELNILATQFHEIVIIPLYYNSEHIIKETKNLRVEKFDYFVPTNRFKVLCKHIGLIIKIYIFELLNSKHRFKYVSQFFKNLNLLLIHIGNSENMNSRLNHYFSGDYKLYTYWFKQHTFSLLLLRDIVKFKAPILSRVHGADWDEERIDYFPFRYWQYHNIDLIVPISKNAKEYIAKNFNINSAKFFVSYLGIPQNGLLAPINKSALHIVSCSGIIPLKQVDSIAKIIKMIKMPVTWTHFGDGQDRLIVQKIIDSFESYQTGIMKGHIANQDFVNFLSNNPVSVFVNWSTSEGIPVSIMEVISVGIPVIAPNVGGVNEIVNSITGYLIDSSEVNSSELAELIENEHRNGNFYNLKKRQSIVNFASKNFSDASNYNTFSRYIAAF